MSMWRIPEFLASGAVVFRMLSGVLLLLVLWEVATLLAVLIGWSGDEGAPIRSARRGSDSARRG
ncbi:MAG: hypothetical protein PVH00_10540 [Gemmatimonadota bacterium]